MPEIPVDFVQALPEPEEGKEYKIVSAELVTTAVQGFKGVRVILEDDEGNQYATMLWLRERVGSTSKLGAFIAVLGRNTDDWIGKRIRIVRWRHRSRQVEVVQG